MKYKEYAVLGALLVPTAALATSVLISLAATHEMPTTETSVYATSPALYYADMEKQP